MARRVCAFRIPRAHSHTAAPDDALRSALQHRFSAGVAWRTLLELGYVGTSGTKLPRFRQMNQAFITQAQIDQLTPDVRTRLEIMGIPDFVIDNFILPDGIAAIPNVARTPFFGYAQLFQAEDTISSHYNSFQAKLDKRFSHGLSLLGAYRGHTRSMAPRFSSGQAPTPLRFSPGQLQLEGRAWQFGLRYSTPIEFERSVRTPPPERFPSCWEMAGKWAQF